MQESIQERKIHTYFDSYGSLFYKKNDIILSGGRPSHYVFFIKKGIVHKYLINALGNAFVVSWIKEEDIFPIFFLNDDINSYHFQAYVPVELKRVPKKKFVDFLQKHPDVGLFIAQKISLNVSQILERLEHLLMSDRIEERLQYLILQLAQQFGKTENGKTIIDIHLTHSDIASYIGATRESVTRCLASLVKSGVLRLEKDCIIANDLATLEEKF